MARRQNTPDPSPRLPEGMTAKEAVFLLGVFARLKEKRFGRLEVTVSDGRVVGVELVEKLDRKSLPIAHKLG